ncbi:DUF222 domain-containing protein, partial [Microtetraspora malaysiensis]
MFTIDDFLPDAAKRSNSTANNATSAKTVPPFLGRLGPDAASVKPLAEAESLVGESVPVSEAHPATASGDDDGRPCAASACASAVDVDADPPTEGPGGGEAGDGTSEQEGPTPGDDSSHAGRVSWPLVAQVRQVASALAVGVVPDAPGVCLAEAEDLLFARDRLISAIAARVERVHAAGEARRAGHASTRSWLRGAAGMSVAGAGRVLALATELARLPTVRARFAEGSLAEGVVTAICSATARLTDEQAALAEPILVGLADQATAAEIARAGRYLRAVLDPDGEADDGEADYRGRFLLVRESASGGVEGEFRLPREAGARLRTLLDAYAKPRVAGDERPLRVRNADVLIALLEQQIGTELLVLINAESLPDDSPASSPGETSDFSSAGTPAPSRSKASGPGRGEASAPDRRSDQDDTSREQGARSNGQPDQSAGHDTGHRRETHDGGRRDEGTRRDAEERGQEAPGQGTRDGGQHSRSAGRDAERGQRAGGRGTRADRPSDRPARDGEQRKQGQARERGRARGQARGRGADWATPGGLISGRTLPGLLLATGQFLPVTDIHRLAQTSGLTRLVM